MSSEVLQSGQSGLPCLGTATFDGVARAVLVDPNSGVARLDHLLDYLSDGSADTVLDVLERNRWAQYAAVFHKHRDLGRLLAIEDVTFCAPITKPNKIWGIGLNYQEHAHDLAESLPPEPASFIKGNHTIIGPDETIPLPKQSKRVTAEAELGLVIGRLARNVPEVDALDYVAGVVPILDQTAEDILQVNPRFLTRSKNFPGFFSFGPWITPLEALADRDLSTIEVATVLNGEVHRKNTVSNMRYSPRFLVSFHSAMMPLFPGDIISTGTPGAAVITPGDRVSAQITGLPHLSNPVA